MPGGPARNATADSYSAVSSSSWAGAGEPFAEPVSASDSFHVRVGLGPGHTFAFFAVGSLVAVVAVLASFPIVPSLISVSLPLAVAVSWASRPSSIVVVAVAAAIITGAIIFARRVLPSPRGRRPVAASGRRAVSSRAVPTSIESPRRTRWRSCPLAPCVSLVSSRCNQDGACIPRSLAHHHGRCACCASRDMRRQHLFSTRIPRMQTCPAISCDSSSRAANADLQSAGGRSRRRNVASNETAVRFEFVCEVSCPCPMTEASDI